MPEPWDQKRFASPVEAMLELQNRVDSPAAIYLL